MRILALEDDRDVRELIVNKLEEQGYLVDPFETGEAAIKALKQRPYDCVVIDKHLPDTSGIALLDEIKKHAPGAPVIVVSGHLSVGDTIEAYRKGVADVFEKPFEMCDLIDRIGAIRGSLEAKIAGEDIGASLSQFCEKYEISPREGDVIRCLMSGRSNAEISGELSISEPTVKSHLKHVFQKTGARSRTHLVVEIRQFVDSLKS